MSEEVFEVEMEEEVEENKKNNEEEGVDNFDNSGENTVSQVESKEEKEEKKELEEVENNQVVDDSNPVDKIKVELNKSKGVMMGEMGTKVSKYPIEKIRFSKQKRERISIMTSNVVVIKRHYHEKTGSFFCFDGKCCEKLGLPDVRYLFPIVVYDTDKKGKPVSTDVDIKILQLGNDLYEDIMSIHDLNGDITKLDLVVTCKDEQYQRVSFQSAGNALWRTNNKVKKFVYNFWKKNNKYLTMAIGKEMTEEEFEQAMDLDTIDSQGSEAESFEDVFNG